MNKLLVCAVAVAGLATAVNAQTLATDTNNNGLSGPGSGVYFDLIAGGSNLTITGLSTAVFANAGDTVTYELWTRSGTYDGNAGSAAGWTSVGVVSGVVSADTYGDFGLLVDLDFADFNIGAGQTTGIALFGSAGVAYQGSSAGAVQNFTDGNLSLFGGGAGTSVFTGVSFEPRVFAGTIDYIPAPGAVALVGVAGLPAPRRRRCYVDTAVVIHSQAALSHLGGLLFFRAIRLRLSRPDRPARRRAKRRGDGRRTPRG